MEFKDKIVIPRSKDDLTLGTTILKDGKLFIRVKDKDYNYIDKIKPRKKVNLYSLPINDVHPEWTKRTVEKFNPRALESWSKLKPGLKVRGIIENNNFIIIRL